MVWDLGVLLIFALGESSGAACKLFTNCLGAKGAPCLVALTVATNSTNVCLKMLKDKIDKIVKGYPIIGWIRRMSKLKI